MDIKKKVDEIGKEIHEIETEIENKTVRLKLLRKSWKEYSKMLERAQELDGGKV